MARGGYIVVVIVVLLLLDVVGGGVFVVSVGTAGAIVGQSHHFGWFLSVAVKMAVVSSCKLLLLLVLQKTVPTIFPACGGSSLNFINQGARDFFDQGVKWKTLVQHKMEFCANCVCCCQLLLLLLHSTVVSAVVGCSWSCRIHLGDAFLLLVDVVISGDDGDGWLSTVCKTQASS